MNFDDLNNAQKDVVNTRGITRVNAGPGTGKTTALLHRIQDRLQDDAVDLDSMAMITFTNNAADELTERLKENHDRPREIDQLTINTFHGLARSIIDETRIPLGPLYDLPEYTGEIELIQNDATESVLFRSFLEDYDAYDSFTRFVDDPDDLRYTLNALSARGIFPTEDGFYARGSELLEGDESTFEESLSALNEQRGGRQSRLRSKLNAYDNYLHTNDAPSKRDLRTDEKTANESLIQDAFHEDRSELTNFIHDCYRSYLTYKIDRNVMTFGGLMMYSSALMDELDPEDRPSIDHLMIDEFQDTSPIQFQLAQRVWGGEDFTAVGDPRQSIYSFQYADVQNMTEFSDRFNQFAGQIRTISSYPNLPVDPSIDTIEMVDNYRSHQTILDESEPALTTAATRYESVEESPFDNLPSLMASGDVPSGETGRYRLDSDHPHESLLVHLQEQINSTDYEPDDVAVLCRTRSYGSALHQIAQQSDQITVPVQYDGGDPSFRSEAAVMTLAWLRILHETDEETGWAVACEGFGLSPDQTRSVLEEPEKKAPDDLVDFREHLNQNAETIPEQVELIHDAYDYTDDSARTIRAVLEDLADHDINPESVCSFIQREIKDPSSHSVETNIESESNKNALHIRTLHGAKGSEFPVVYLHGLDNHVFPSPSRSNGAIYYSRSLGIRQSKQYDPDREYIVRNWAHDALSPLESSGYDEERRLLYVGCTRAEESLNITATDGRESSFFENLDSFGPVEEWDLPENYTPDSHVGLSR